MIQARDAASAVLSKFKNLLHETGEEAGHAKAAIAGLGIVGLAVATVAAKIGEDAVKDYASFQSAAAELGGQADMTSKQIQAFSNTFLESFGGMEDNTTTFMQAFAGVAGTFETIQGHALTTAQAVKAMGVAEQLAEASGDSLAQATSDMTSVLLATGGKTQDAAKDMNVLFNTSRLTGIGIDQVTTMLNRLAPSLARTGVGIGQASGMLIEMVKHFGTSRKTVTMAGTAIRDLADPSAEAAAEMDILNVKTDTASGKFVGVAAALNKFREGLTLTNVAQNRAQLLLATYGTGMTTAEGKVSNATLQAAVVQKIFGASLAPVVMSLMGASGQLRAYGDAANKAGVLQHAASLESQTWSAKVKELHSAIHDAVTAIGAGLAPVVTELINKIVPLITHISEWITKHKTLSAEILGSLFVFGLLTAAVAALSLVLMAVSGPIALVVIGFMAIAAAAGLIAAAVLAPKDLEKALEKLGMSTRTATEVTRDLQEAWRVMKDVAVAVWGVLGPIVSAALKQIEAVVTLFGDLIHGRWSKIWGDLIHLAEASLRLLVAVFVPGVHLMEEAGEGAHGGPLARHRVDGRRRGRGSEASRARPRQRRQVRPRRVQPVDGVPRHRRQPDDRTRKRNL